MLCRSIAVEGIDKIQNLLKGAEMAEIRIEKSGLNIDEVEYLFKQNNNLIATCRDDNGLLEEERTALLKSAIKGGAKWIDIEVESDKNYAKILVEYAKSYNCNVIISYHNYTDTPNKNELTKIVEDCINMGADLVKLATTVINKTDIINLFDLYNSDTPILALGMGELGKITRITALKLGAPFTFVSCDSEDVTAPGQISETQMKNILNIL
jgi:3-dehydroquinate dehydratase type I